MKLKKFPVTSTGRDKKEAREMLSSMMGEPGAKPFQGRLVYGAKSIKALRQRMGLPQPGFARLIQVDVTAVQSWEQGRRVPDSSRMAMIHLLIKHREFRGLLEEAAQDLHPETTKSDFEQMRA